MTPSLDEMNGPTSPSPRTVSFSTTSSSPLFSPTTSSSHKGSEEIPPLIAFDIPPSPSRLVPPSTTSLPKPTWTPTQDERLIFVRASLKAAQRRWSASQEIWLEEEHHLLELRAQHRKSLKQQQHEKDVASKAAGVWKARTWGRRLSRRASRTGSAAVTAPAGEIGDEDAKKRADEVEYAADQGNDDYDTHDDDEATLGLDSSSEEDNATGKHIPRPTVPRANNSNTISSALHRLSLHVRKPSGTGKPAGSSRRTSRRASRNASRAPSHPATLPVDGSDL